MQVEEIPHRRLNPATSREADQVNRDGSRPLRCGAGVVDHVIDDADTAEGDRQHVVQLDPRRVRDLEATRCVNRRVDVKEAVAAQTPTLVRLDGVGHLVGGVAVDAVVRPSRLVRRVVRHLVLEHDRATLLAIPDDLVLLVVLNEQAVRRDVVAVDDHAGVGGVERPAHPVAVVSPPGPDVVQQDVVAVHDEARRGLAWAGAADAEEHVLDRGRVCRVALVGMLGAHLQQYRRVHGAGVEQQSGKLDPFHVGDRHCHDPVVRHERGKAQSQHHGVRALDLDRTVQVVDTRGEDQVLASGESDVDRLRRVRRFGDEETLDRDGRTGGRPVGPGRALGVTAQGRDEDFVMVVRVDIQERLFPGHRAGRQRRVWRGIEWGGGERLGWGAHDAGEDLVPDAVGPASDLAVPHEELLLRTIDDEASVGVGDEAATRKLRTGSAVVHEREVAAGDVDPPHWRRLRDSPEVARGTAAGQTLDVDREVRQRAPEVVERDAVAGG